MPEKLTLDQYAFSEMSLVLAEGVEEYQCIRNNDISDFFHVDFYKYKEQLLGKSYCFFTEEIPHKIVCAFTVSNASINMLTVDNHRRNQINREIPNPKRRNQYPAVLIGRLAVFDGFDGRRLGDELLDFIKAWFIDPLNKTGCRFIVVDAVNHKKVLQYYVRNGFTFLYDSEEEESEALRKRGMSDEAEEALDTRLMYFDLIKLRAS